MPDRTMGQMETRLLALERKQARIDDILRTDKRQIVALSQGIWDEWSDVQAGESEPANPCADGTTDFAPICACVPTTLPLTDSFYGTCTITYNPTTKQWFGCKIVNYPGAPLCLSAANAALSYVLTGTALSNTWGFQAIWVGHQVIPGSQFCPTANATCAQTQPGQPNRFASTGVQQARINCSGVNQWVIAGGNSGIYPTGAFISIDFTGGS